MPFASVAGHRVEYVELPSRRPGAPTLVFLHEGLGSIAGWRDFPARVCEATGCGALVYSRHGYGRSDVLTEPRTPDYLHVEAREALPELLDLLEVDDPILVGHSDGASIALIYGGSGFVTRGIVAMAPHVFVEDVTVAGVAAAGRSYEPTGMRDRLARFHRDPDATFRGWHDAWLDPAFRDWNIEQLLPLIACPILAIQGKQDEYATMAQLDAIERKAGGPVTRLELPDCGHSPHRDRPDDVREATTTFITPAA